MADCIFCNIVEGNVPARIVYEDEYTMAIMSNAQDVDGHILIIPKKHIQGVIDGDIEVLSQVMDTVHKVSKHLVDNCGYGGVNLLNASGEDAEQSVQHLHIHLIPRKKGDGLNTWPEFNCYEFNIEETFNRIKMTD